MSGGNINSKVDGIQRKVNEHDTQIATVQTITTLGFIIALITLAGVVITAVIFAVDEMHQSNQQTQLLQEIKDKVGR